MPHAPFRHTSFVPHAVPFVAFAPVSAQTLVPVEQSVLPTWQALLGVHVAPDVQATHEPASHTMLVPQLVPSAALLPVSVHVGELAEQSSLPVWHGALVGTHAAPVTHAVQTPLSQTLFGLQGVPSGKVVPVSLQMGTPVEQSVMPWWHTFAGEQAVPDPGHGTQFPS
jgi:hypothetical protein